MKLVDEVYGSFAKANKAQLERDRFLTALNTELRLTIINEQSSLKSLADVKNLAMSIKSSNKATFKPGTKWQNKAWDKKPDTNNHPKHPNNRQSSNKKNERQLKSKHSVEEQSEARRQFAKLMLNGIQVMALLDTGSQVSLVPPYFDVQAPHSKQTHAVNGSKINTRGMGLIHVKFMEDSLSHNFVVAEVKTSIIGRDFLIKVKGNIRFDNYLEYSWNNQSHLCPLYLKESFFHICDLSDEEDCSILVEDLSLTESSPTDNRATSCYHIITY